MALTAKQSRFCDEFVKNYNATQAAIRAGYSGKTAAVQGSRLLKNPEIIERINENQKQLVEQSGLSEEMVILQLLSIYKKCMSDEPVMQWDYNEHELVESGTYQFDSKGALNAIKLLGQHLGMFKQKVELSSVSDESVKEMEKYFADKKASS